MQFYIQTPDDQGVLHNASTVEGAVKIYLDKMYAYVKRELVKAGLQPTPVDEDFFENVSAGNWKKAYRYLEIHWPMENIGVYKIQLTKVEVS